MFRGHEVHDIPDDEGAVEHLGLAEGSEIELDQVRDDPSRSRVVRARHGDKHGIDVNTDDVVSELGEVPAMSSWAAPGVEESRSSWRESIDQTCLPVEIITASSHLPEAVSVPPGVAFVGEARPG